MLQAMPCMMVTTGTALSAPGEMMRTSGDEEEEQELIVVTGGPAGPINCVFPLAPGEGVASMDVITTLNTIKMVPKVARPTRCRASRSMVLGQGILPMMARTMRMTAAMMKKMMGDLNSWSRNVAISCPPFSYLDVLIVLPNR